jgi:hypothetical protein
MVKKTYSQSGELLLLGKTSIGNLEGYKSILISTRAGSIGRENDKIATQIINLINKDRLLSISYEEQEQIEPYKGIENYQNWIYKDTLSQILSTFKFINR